MKLIVYIGGAVAIVLATYGAKKLLNLLHDYTDHETWDGTYPRFDGDLKKDGNLWDDQTKKEDK
jgi:hypothetical protein